MSQDNNNSPSFFQQFIVLFLIITMIQWGFSYFEFDQYFFGKPDPIVLTDEEMPPVIATPLPVKTIDASASKIHVSFEENTGQIHEISLKNHWTNMSREQEIFTLFYEKEGHEEKEQGIIDGFLILNEDTQEYEKAQCLSTKITQDPQKIIVSKDYEKFSAQITYILTDGYVLDKEIDILAKESLEIYSYTELRNKNHALVKGTEQGFRMFQGASFHTEKTKYSKIPFAQYGKKSFREESITEGWVAFSQRYFATAISSQSPATLYSNYLSNQNICVAGFVTPAITIAKGEHVALSSQIYSGPEDRTLLSDFAPGLEYVIDFGVFWPICDALLSCLIFFQGFLGDWGASIIMLTLAIRLFAFITSLSQQKTLANIQRLQPKQTALRATYADNDEAYNKALWALHKQENISYFGMFFATIINPLLQLPIFFGFYSLLLESITLRQTTFMGVTGDLSLSDPTYILPLLLLLSSLLQQRVSPPIQNPDMAMAIKMMPFFFAFLSTTFPSGLLIYWIASNLMAALQMAIRSPKAHEPAS